MPDPLVHQFGRISAIRYGNTDGEWDEGATARVAQFVLGQSVTNAITQLNQQLMHVVQPVEEFWDPKNGLADIVITDPKAGIRVGLALGQWLARYPSGNFRPLPHNVVVASYLPPPPSESFEAELRKLLVKHERVKGSGTPDHLLAEFLTSSLSAYTTAIRKRAQVLNESIN